MKIKNIATTVTFVATVLLGSLINASPAEALSFGDTLKFTTADKDPSNLATLTSNVDGSFSFDAGILKINENSPFGAAGSSITDAVLTLRQVAADPSAIATYELVGNNVLWLSGLQDDMGGLSRTYTLTSFILNQEGSPNSFGSFAFSAIADGFIQPPTPGVRGIGGLGGFGGLSSDGSTISGQVAVVPTPAAVLPGLIGLGTAAFRKKKKAGEETLATADA